MFTIFLDEIYLELHALHIVSVVNVSLSFNLKKVLWLKLFILNLVRLLNQKK